MPFINPETVSASSTVEGFEDISSRKYTSPKDKKVHTSLVCDFVRQIPFTLCGVSSREFNQSRGR